ncbi:MAG TPA: glycoside hydrolase family 16 protein [Polyangiaceae bacterium]|nr:glycoside hydrolase family 16 protein [Polyangiaceae bacterium]
MPRTAQGKRFALLALLLSGWLGCSEQDLSIGWQDLGGTDAPVTGRNDAPVSGDGDATVSGRIDASVSGDADASVSAEAGRFVIIWRDDFDTLDPGRWEVAEHTFEENYADFSLANAVADAGFLKLGIRVKPTGSAGKPYTAAEVRTWATFTCGKFLVRSRVAPAVGVATTFFGFHDFFQDSAAQNWNEIVIESAAPSRIDYVYTRENPSAPAGKERVASTSTVPFDAAAGFHVYGFEWTPNEVRYLVDGAVTQSLSADIAARLTRPKRIVMSAYPSTRLARPFDASGLPSEAWYDWIEVYRFTGPCPTGVDGGTDAADAPDYRE